MWKICQKYDTKSTDEKYYKCGHIHRSAKCCKTKFTQIGQTQINVAKFQTKPDDKIWKCTLE